MLTDVLKRLPAETAHRAAIAASRALRWLPAPTGDPRLRVEAFGLSFPNPIGLAAGFDKSAEAVEGLGRLGFGFVEVGTVTPLPQRGNAKPRLFRLDADRAIVNRMGFNNDGYAQVISRLQRASRRGIVGVNIGPNKEAVDRIADYVLGVKTFADVADYFTINISSPNTPGLRDLHAHGELERLLASALAARDLMSPVRPVLLKIAPDLDEDALDVVLSLSLTYKVDGLIVSNTTIARPPTLQSPGARQAGGLSGPPLFSPSTRMVARCFLKLGNQIPIVGVGGIDSVATALQKMEAGARLIQIYTGLIYHGPRFVAQIAKGLTDQLNARNLSSIGDIVGIAAQKLASD